MEKAGGIPSAPTNIKIKNPPKEGTSNKLPEGTSKGVGVKAPHRELYSVNSRGKMKVPAEDGTTKNINALAGVTRDDTGNIASSPDAVPPVKGKRSQAQPVGKV